MELTPINIYRAIPKSGKVWKTLTLGEIFQMVKDNNSELAIQNIQARKALEVDNSLYVKYKLSTPTATMNFTFNQYRKNQNIIRSTNLIYCDIDNDIKAYKHPLIYASGESYSGKGSFCIIKCSGIISENFNYNLSLLNEVLPFEMDSNALKPTQQWVIPYSPGLKVFNNSEVWIAREQIKRTHYTSTEKNKNISRTELDTFSTINPKLRLNNIDEVLKQVNFDGEPLWDAGTRIPIAEVFAPRIILEGNRNKFLYAIGYQIRALNPQSPMYQILGLLTPIAKKNCKPQYPFQELKALVISLMELPREELNPVLNSTKRFFFNKDYDLSGKERQSLAAHQVNKIRRENTRSLIHCTIQAWDFKLNGKITQKKIVLMTGKNIKTVGNYYSEFKALIKELNEANLGFSRKSYKI